jgi:alginate O-acetyltransferase complex protein AlgI
MAFPSLIFLVFFCITFLSYYYIPQKYRWIQLLLASAFFIGYASIGFLAYSIGFALFNFYIGKAIAQQITPKAKKNYYRIGLWINILQICFFKYTNFIIENINAAFSFHEHTCKIPYIDIIVPLGISFYTFQTIGYLINIYKGIEKPEKHVGIFVLSVLFFAKFVSGPVERTKTFLPQFHLEVTFNYTRIIQGLQQALWGLFKKVVVADGFAKLITNTYNDTSSYSGSILWFVIVLQVVYLYCDFSGYTDIALGISKTLGFNLTPNFDRPFFATNVSTFWRRWHMSLSNWCNDYIFKQTMFNRRKWGNWAAVYAAFLTFFVVGIWHGARWTFVILGLLQATAISYEFFFKRQRLQWGQKIPLWINNFSSRILTYIFFCFSIVFFFAPDFHSAKTLYSHLFIPGNFSADLHKLGVAKDELFISLLFLLSILWIDWYHERGKHLSPWFYSQRKWIRYTIYYLIVMAIILSSFSKANNFVYQQF